jgi:hypothetical protein
MLTAHCDACGEFVPREFRATVEVRFGKTQRRFELCASCQYGAVNFLEEQVGVEVLGLSRELWSEAERAEFQREALGAVGS